MKIFKSFSITILLVLIVGITYGIIEGLSLLCVFLGIDELINAKDAYDKGNKKLAFVYAILGIGACACIFLSFTNIL